MVYSPSPVFLETLNQAFLNKHFKYQYVSYIPNKFYRKARYRYNTGIQYISAVNFNSQSTNLLNHIQFTNQL